MADTRFKPGQSGNPAGRPRLSDDLKRAKLLTKQEFQRTLDRLIRLPIGELERIATDPHTPTLELICATVAAKAVKNGDHCRLDFLLDRLIGKVKEEVEHSLPKPTIIKYKDEKLVLTTDQQEAGDDGEGTPS